ncbi:hypothetical protein DPX39_100129900 [Trypanosoma brucei equiperdum]|uniref:Uncharacterized protein n=1 Tax=Trypanosoma brucei equiperdum TaxID=630700 RepID=A0A3L6KZW0_9TRYP|nr:hypothetical protein DPX39_100129900 [Trypanosoma brucei equiperdum]
MRVALTIDSTCDDLFEAVSRIVASGQGGVTSLVVNKRHNAVPNTVVVEKDGNPSRLLLLITCSDLQLLFRSDCAHDYLKAAHRATACPIYIVVIGYPTGPRCPPFWTGVAQLCTDSHLLDVLVGIDFASSVERSDEIVVAHGMKATKDPKVGQNLVRMDGRRKCDPTDFDTLYLDMLSEIATVSEHRASIIKSAFPSLHALLEAIDSGTLERVRVRGYDEERSCSTLDPYISKVLSTDYTATGSVEGAASLVEVSKKFFQQSSEK